MASVTNGRVLFNEIPTGYPEPETTVIYDNSEKIDLDTVPLGGGFLLKTLVLSIDPYMRPKMRPAGGKSYSSAFELGKPVYNYAVSVVLRSDHPDIKARDHLYGRHLFQEYAVETNASKFRVLKNEEQLPWSLYLGICGMPGKTAYMGWKAYVKAKKGETLFVSTGAGPVGSLVVQLAKRDRLKVIASAGSEEKIAFLKKIGADVAFNYKTTSTAAVLEEHGPINMYWDNVGGETLEAALGAAAPFARFVECGMISIYNGPPYTIKNLMQIVGKNITIQGFIYSYLERQYDDAFYREVPAQVARGELKYLQDATQGLQGVGQAILDVLTGKNTGKRVIVVSEDQVDSSMLTRMQYT